MDSLIRRLQAFRLGENESSPDDSHKSESGKGTMLAQKLISTGTLGAANRGRLLQALYDIGASSRADLARVTGVTRGTIGGIVQPLLDQGVLAEGEVIPPNETGGKPATKLWFSKDARPICAVLLLHDRVSACLVSLEGEVYAQHAVDFPKNVANSADAFRIISTCVEKAVAFGKPILGIGVAVAGMINTETGTIVTVSLAPFLDGFPLETELNKRFGVTVCVDQDTRALLVGDRWFGQGRGRRNFASVYIGETLGGALYLDGHLYRGPAGAGGEIGHTTVDIKGRMCQCGRRGCWETIASSKWLRTEAKVRRLPRPLSLDVSRLLTLADKEVPGARELIRDYTFNIAVGLANLQQFMAPNFIVIHGDIVRGGGPILRLIQESFHDLVFHRPGDDIALAFGDGECLAALRGAASLLLSELLNFVI
ncbi:ROK family protein [Rhizobium ruizarguesonis]|uniref:ROK family protein n=1 Tax=Rhizobium ruizarguesonis TaxID=2081791 RepID=UPI001030662E|nr:ROK family protein [Rhizobium ruizarguesonis]TAY30544.1 ROK family protein [Rhizobium ruizarguesonis]TAY42737.1 ROK family protein [Rhizobium ruizarguesonis]